MRGRRDVLAEQVWDLLRHARILEFDRVKSFAQLTGPSRSQCLDWAEFMMLDVRPLLEQMREAEKLLSKAADHLHAANQILLHERLIDDDLDYLNEEAMVSELQSMSLKIDGLIRSMDKPND